MEEIRHRIKSAGQVAALTGAGVSAESGVPTFRGPDGLWKNHKPEELATPEAFARNPELVWEWYNWRRGLMAEVKPNPGHYALARLEKHANFTLITQNVDGLHAVAGSKNLYELHGSIWKVRCTGCGTTREDRTVPLPYPPLCRECGKTLRPDVVWFGESLNQTYLEASFAAAARSDLMLVIGTSALVQPAASLAWEAKRAGAFVVEINMERTPFSGEADAVLTGPSGKILAELIPELDEV